mgnify:CR=1 FL=1
MPSLFKYSFASLQLGQVFVVNKYATCSGVLTETFTSIFDALDIQDELQALYTSGTVFHAFLGEKLPDWKAAVHHSIFICQLYIFFRVNR